jgi:hypothetical protein
MLGKAVGVMVGVAVGVAVGTGVSVGGGVIVGVGVAVTPEGITNAAFTPVQAVKKSKSKGKPRLNINGTPPPRSAKSRAF